MILAPEANKTRQSKLCFPLSPQRSFIQREFRFQQLPITPEGDAHGVADAGVAFKVEQHGALGGDGLVVDGHDEVAAEAGYNRPPPPIFTMNFNLLTERDPLLKAARVAVAGEPAKRPVFIALDIPRSLAQRTGHSGDANMFLVPADARLEAVAQRLIDSPGDVLPRAESKNAENAEQQSIGKIWREFSKDRLRKG